MHPWPADRYDGACSSCPWLRSSSRSWSAPSPANADPGALQDAKARANRLADQVEALELKVEIAGERLAGAQRRAWPRRHPARCQRNQELAELSTAAQSSRAATNERVRALYMAGGQAGLYASVLDGGSSSTSSARVDAVGRVLDRDRATQRRTARPCRRHQRLQTELTALAQHARPSSRRPPAASEHEVDALLGHRKAALGDAGAEVRRLTAELAGRSEPPRPLRRRPRQLGGSGPLPTELPAGRDAGG